MQKNKTCQICGNLGHSKFYCRVRRPKPIPKMGKIAKKWLEVKNEWFQKNATSDGLYPCHYCGIIMTKEQCTLDHLQGRGSHPELRFDLDNLVPCCLKDNSLKGSMSYETFCKQYYPHLLE